MIDAARLCGVSVCTFRVSYRVCTDVCTSLLIILQPPSHHLITGVAPSPSVPAAPTRGSADGTCVCVCVCVGFSTDGHVCERERVGFGGDNRSGDRRTALRPYVP